MTYKYYGDIKVGQQFIAEEDNGSYIVCVKVLTPSNEEAYIVISPNTIYEYGSPFMLVIV